MAKITTTTTTIAYLLIAAAAALPPMKAPPSEPAPAPAPARVAAPPSIMAAASPPQLDCFSYLADAGDCLDFVMNGSKLHKPARKCCPELANLTVTHPICLCELLLNSTQFGFSIDTNKAFKLPSLCNISTPHVSSCAAIPSPSPAKAPGNEDNASPTISVLPYNQHFLIGLLLIFNLI